MDIRGSITLSNITPPVPIINPNFLATPFDRSAGARLAQRFAALPTMQSELRLEPVNFDPELSDEQLDAWIEEDLGSIFHPMGTCRAGKPIGKHSELGVVGSELRVRGVKGLRVVDASVLVSLLSFFLLPRG